MDRADLLVMLDELKGSLPSELSEAETISRECDAVVAAVEEEARRIVEVAHERAESMVEDTELYRRSQRRADESVDRAERYAEEIAGGSEAYRGRVMGQLENWFEDSIVSVRESRRELNGAPVRPPAPSTERTEENDSHSREGWRASSA